MSETDKPGGPSVIETPCAVVVSTARAARGRSVIFGWTPDRWPMATTRMDGLSDEARRVIEGYAAAGLPARRVPYSAFVPVTYVLTGPAVDFADTAERRAEDQVRYTIVDARGERREVVLGERGVLGAIAEARVPWQAAGADPTSMAATSAVPLYTVIAPQPGASPETALAFLFEPTIAGNTNEPAFRSFVRNTIGRLLVLDESQPKKSRKGYMEIAGKVAGTPPEGGTASLLSWMRRAGLVDFDDSWLRGLDLGKRRLEGQLIRGLRAIGMVDVDDRVMADLLDPRPDYDIDPLELAAMLDLAEQMYHVARRNLG